MATSLRALQRYARRGTTTQRLGRKHPAKRKQALAAHRDGDLCWRCGHPMYKWQRLDLDHVIDRAHGGVDGPVRLAHASCNRSAGARAGNHARAQHWQQYRRW